MGTQIAASVRQTMANSWRGFILCFRCTNLSVAA